MLNLVQHTLLSPIFPIIVGPSHHPYSAYLHIPRYRGIITSSLLGLFTHSPLLWDHDIIPCRRIYTFPFISGPFFKLLFKPYIQIIYPTGFVYCLVL